MKKGYITRVTINSCLLDDNAHLNNSQAGILLDDARFSLFASLGLSPKEMHTRGLVYVVTEKNTRYLRQAFLDEDLQISTRIRPYQDNNKIVLVQRMFRSSPTTEIIIGEETTYKFIDKQNGRGVTIPRNILEILNQNASS